MKKLSLICTIGLSLIHTHSDTTYESNCIKIPKPKIQITFPPFETLTKRLREARLDSIVDKTNLAETLAGTTTNSFKLVLNIEDALKEQLEIAPEELIPQVRSQLIACLLQNHDAADDAINEIRTILTSYKIPYE